MMGAMKIGVLFVCTGNICRSPTAHGIFEALVEKEGLAEFFTIDSAGTTAYHVGESPDPRSQEHAKKRGYDLSHIRARQVVRSDFEDFDFVLAMDGGHLKALLRQAPPQSRAEVALFLDHHPGPHTRDVPDPYYGGAGGFEEVLDLVEGGASGFLTHLRQSGRL
jgi:protein-tyrosine phosphatase